MREHDHNACVERVISYAEERSKESSFRFTPVRRRVLEILLEEHRALGAYDLLKRLEAEGMKAQPPIAYRALEFLEKHGFVHKLERLNAFVACMHPEDDHEAAFVVCRECHAVAETQGPSEISKLQDSAAEIGFSVENVFVEVQGLCPDCAPKT
ncbi:MAG: Fur family transcriptional regulator [Pseudomonadota bacterium]